MRQACSKDSRLKPLDSKTRYVGVFPEFQMHVTWWHVHGIDTRGLRTGVEARLVDRCCRMDTRQELVHCAAVPCEFILHGTRRMEAMSTATPNRGDEQSCTRPTRHKTYSGDAWSCTRPPNHKTPGLVQDRRTTKLWRRPVLYKTAVRTSNYPPCWSKLDG